MVDMSKFLNLEYIMLEKLLTRPKHNVEVSFTREGAVKTKMWVGFEVKYRIERLQEAWLTHTDERKKHRRVLVDKVQAALRPVRAPAFNE